jgi:hypothetical protein
MMQAAAGDTSNLAEWWAAILAGIAILISLGALWQARRIQREVHEPGWQVIVRGYYEVGEVDGQPGNSDSGTEWRVENVGNTDGKNVSVHSRWGRRLQLPAASTADLGTVKAGTSNLIVLRSSGARPQAATTWPMRADYQRSAEHARFRPFYPVKVRWTATTGRRRTRWASVQIHQDITFKTADRP